ncbi:MerR family transcriptional regulator [Labrys neptuniae]
MSLSELAFSGESAELRRGESRKEQFTIHELVTEFEVTSRTLRFYEEKGLLNPTRRGQERIFSRRDRARLKLVLLGKRVGFSLEEAKAMLDLYDLGDGQVTQLRVSLERFEEKLAELDRRRRDIDDAYAELSHARDIVRGRLARQQK